MPPAAAPRLPVGFFLAGMLSMCFSALMLLVLVGTELEGHTDAWAVALRGSCVLLASLGAITTEALWKTRREAYPASLALAACFAAWVLGMGAVQGTLAASVAFLGICAVVVGPMLRYLHVRSRQLWPRAAVPVAAPRP